MRAILEYSPDYKYEVSNFAPMGRQIEDYVQLSAKCLERHDYRGSMDYALLQYKKTSSSEDEKRYEDRKRDYELYTEMQRIISKENEDNYSILGVDKEASMAEIHKAFRTLASKYHPTKVQVRGSLEAMRIIQKAYFEMNTPKKREEYNWKRTHKAAFDSRSGGSGTAFYSDYSGDGQYYQTADILRNIFTNIYGRENTRSSDPFFAQNQFYERNPFSDVFYNNSFSSSSFGMDSSPLFSLYNNLYRHAQRSRTASHTARGGQMKQVSPAVYLCVVLFILIFLFLF